MCSTVLRAGRASRVCVPLMRRPGAIASAVSVSGVRQRSPRTQTRGSRETHGSLFQRRSTHGWSRHSRHESNRSSSRVDDPFRRIRRLAPYRVARHSLSDLPFWHRDSARLAIITLLLSVQFAFSTLGSRPYTDDVRVSVTWVLAAFLSIIACADPLCCSDGCDRGGMTPTHSTQTGADCPTCLSAVVPPYDAPIVRLQALTRARELRALGPTSLFRTDVDHPPRLA